jgi:hypothetical protein
MLRRANFVQPKRQQSRGSSRCGALETHPRRPGGTAGSDCRHHCQPDGLSPCLSVVIEARPRHARALGLHLPMLVRRWSDRVPIENRRMPRQHRQPPPSPQCKLCCSSEVPFQPSLNGLGSPRHERFMTATVPIKGCGQRENRGAERKLAVRGHCHWNSGIPDLEQGHCHTYEAQPTSFVLPPSFFELAPNFDLI